MNDTFKLILWHIEAYANFLKNTHNIPYEKVLELDIFKNHLEFQLNEINNSGEIHTHESIIDLLRNHLILSEPTEIAAVDERLENWVGSSENLGSFKGLHYSHYVQKLIAGGKSNLIGQLDQDTLTILDCCANPKSDTLFDRRGLVYGHVQSGKTANYLGLISRAFDHGYKIVIVLAGLNEDLRQQTQERIENSLLLETKEYKIRRATSLEYDFAAIANHTDLTGRERSIWVVKKNKIVLENIIEWFSVQAQKSELTFFQEPVLIIDDEADNASIQSLTASEFASWETGMELEQLDIEDLTEEQLEKLEKARNTNISTINRLIRVLLSTLGKKTFVQYTATPYSVINQTTEDLERTVTVRTRNYILSDNDLFPEHFIIPLKAGNSYFGLEKTFNTNKAKNIPFFQNINTLFPNEELERIFTTRRDSYFLFDQIPDSLKTAILEFLVTIVIKNFRNIEDHNSMLIHTTFKTDDINYLHSKVQDFLNYVWIESRQPTSNTLLQLNKILKRLKERSKAVIYDDYFIINKLYPENITSNDIQAIQNNLNQPISVVAYHSTSNQSLQYNLKDGDGNKKYKNYIIIGGNKLARGLTIEGLNTTYFTRNSTRRDSLYQMGRWFGYRIGFEDIISIYTTNKTFSDYQSIYIIEKHLRDDFEINMERECPILPKNAIIKLAITSDELNTEFGKLPFPCDPSKLRKTIESALDSTGHTRTSQFEKEHISKYAENLLKSINFIRELDDNYERFDYDNLPKHINRNISFTNIPSDLILKFLESLFHSGRMSTDFGILREFISENSAHLTNWSVSLINRSNNSSFNPEFYVGQTEIKQTNYQPSNASTEDVIKFGSVLAREAGDTAFDLIHIDPTICTEKEVKRKRQNLKIPLILIYPNYMNASSGYFENDVQMPIIDVYIPDFQGLKKINYRIRRSFN